MSYDYKESSRRYAASERGKKVHQAYREAHRLEARAWHKAYYEKPMIKYMKQRDGASIRGIPFLLTFEEWWSVWENSGKWSERGRGANNYAMCRTGDSGPYVLGNVRIDTNSNNMKECHAIKREKRVASFP